MRIAMKTRLAIMVACLPMTTHGGELARCTAVDKSYSYLTRQACKAPGDIREAVSATRAIASTRPEIKKEVMVIASPSPLERQIDNDIQAYWRPCKLVKAAKLKIESAENKVVRYSYVLKLLSDGAMAKPADCPAANSSMLQALANEDLAKLKVGTEVVVTQEQAIR